jgi:hypothetical protein
MPTRSDWSLSLGGRLRSLAVAREAGLALVATDDSRLTLVDPTGRIAAQASLPGPTAALAAADDGSSFAVACNSRSGPGLAIRLDASLRATGAFPRPSAVTAVALDGFGQVLLVADQRVNLRAYGPAGDELRRWETPRPLFHLAFVPGSPLLVGAADFGFVGGLDLRTDAWVWRDQPLNHVGGLAVAGDGTLTLAAGFRAGVQGYDRAGRKRGRPEAFPPARSVCLSYDAGRAVLLAIDGAVVGTDPDARERFRWPPPSPTTVVGLALSWAGDRVWVAGSDGELICRSFVG